ncbi:MAG: 3-deoxy-D-manno-octulosonic acid transferase [Puniceicoccaceae bacterium]
MIWLYRLAFPFVLLAATPWYLRHALRRGGYGWRFLDRFGFAPRPPAARPGAPTLWLQAVSVGEVLAAQPVLGRLRTARPDARLILTTTTTTGFHLARGKVSSADFIAYFPLDFFPAVHRTWKRFRPDLCLLMEGEVWPEHLHHARVRGVPVWLVNARLSDRSHARYRRAGRLGTALFRPLGRILCASAEDAERIRRIAPGAVPVETVGNLKFDVDLPPKPEGAERLAALRALGLAGGAETPPLILLGSSIWPGEEAVLCEAFREIRRAGIAVRLVLVPRHAERRREFRAGVCASGLSCALRSEDGPARPGTDVYLADTTGELRHFTGLADLAFIGKSLPPHEGGQTPIEAGAYGIPMVYGPRMSNFKAACRGLEAKHGAIRVDSAREAVAAIVRLAGDPGARGELARNARAWRDENRGSIDRTVAAILEGLPRPDPR